MREYIIRVADHFVRLSSDLQQVEYVSESDQATRFDNPLNASVRATELRLPDYLVIPCPQ
jgi:hypothetical protein